MIYEKIVKREDGLQYLIRIDAYMDSYKRGMIQYRVAVFYRGKGKRAWVSIDKGIYDHEYRKLSMDERREYDEMNNLKFVTKEEIYAAKIELWNLLKPQM